MVIRMAAGFVLGVVSVLLLAGVALFGGPYPYDRAVALYGGGESQFINFPDGTQAHFRDQGNPEGPPVVLLHGEGASLETWEAWVDVLGDRYRMISLDLPGHGLTGRTVRREYNRLGMTNFVLRFAHELDLEDFVLVGHDLGGSVAWNLARYRPQRVTQLVLITPDGIGTVPTAPTWMDRLAASELTRPLLRWIGPRWFVAGELRRSFYHADHATPEMIDRYWRMGRLEGNREVALTRHAGRPWVDLERLNVGIEVPTLIVWGANDEVQPYDPYRVAWDLRTKFAGGAVDNPVEVVAATGHVPQVERPRETALLFDRFVRNHSAETPLAAETRNP